MKSYKVAIIGCGRPLRTEGATGFGMSHRHMAGFVESGKCELAAVADISRENAEAFIATHNPEALIFSDYKEMMAKVEPDIVSVCLWPHLHAEIVCNAATFKPAIIYCEKPMDIHWDASLKMHQACEDNGVLLAINHQRRFNLPLLKTKQLIDDGVIGKVQHLSGAWHNLMDAGTHVLDMMFYFNGDEAVEWVIGQIDIRGARKVFGALHAGHGITEFRFRNGVRATYNSGINCRDYEYLLRITGTRGMIDLYDTEPWLKIHEYEKPGWHIIDTGENIHDDKAIYRAIADVLEAYESQSVPQMSSINAIRTTEVIFAAHESSRRRARVDLPLESMPSPLLDMVESGQLKLEE